MFGFGKRKKKPVEAQFDPAVDMEHAKVVQAERPTPPVDTTPEPVAPPQHPLKGVGQRPVSRNVTQPELPQRRFEAPRVSAPTRASQVTPNTGSMPPVTSSAANGAEKRLVVGPGIRLTGDIAECDRLVVEGEIDAVKTRTGHLDITESGIFRGSCEVETAIIHGLFDGELLCRGVLMVKPGGQLRGNIRYDEMEIMRGAKLSGVLHCTKDGDQPAPMAGIPDSNVVTTQASGKFDPSTTG